MGKRKYMVQRQIKSLSDFEKCNSIWFQMCRDSGNHMWHKSALISLQVRTLINFINSGCLYSCVPINEKLARCELGSTCGRANCCIVCEEHENGNCSGCDEMDSVEFGCDCKYYVGDEDEKTERV